MLYNIGRSKQLRDNSARIHSSAAIAALFSLAVLAPHAQAQTGSFTIIALPDTQYYSETYPQTFTAQTQWIVNNASALNIQAVLGLGDIVQTATNVSEWQNADASVKLLDNANIPYLLAIGNHDYSDSGSTSGRTAEATNFNTYFGPSRYQNYSWYKGQYPSGSNENFYGVLNINGKQYLFLMLEFYPRDSAIAWANSVLAGYPGAEVIVVTHANVYIDNTLVSRCDQLNAQAYNVGSDNNGDGLWSKFISQHSNISLVLSGHFTGSGGLGASRRTDLGVNGNIVNQMLSDYQEMANGGNGYLRILQFNPSASPPSITVSTYSPTLNAYLTDSNNQFTVTWHSTGSNPSGTGTVSGIVKDVSTCNAISGATASTNTGVSGTTNSSGNFSLGVPTPQQYTVSLQAGGYAQTAKTANAWTNYPEFAKYFLSTQASGSISGKVTDSSGAGIAGVTVSYSDGSTTTDSNGNYSLSNVLVGSYTVTAAAAGYQTVSTPNVAVNSGTTTTTNITLTGLGSISGIVLNSSGAAVAGATVSYSGGSTTSAANGSYTLANVPTGTYNVSASASGYQSSTQMNVVVNVNATATVNFTLSTAGGQSYSIQGSITPASLGSGSSVSLTGPTLVQSAHSSSGSGNSSATVSLTAASGAGDTILVFTKTGGNTVTTVTDNQTGGSNTYTAATTATQWGVSPNPTDRWAQVFVAKNITGGSPLTITVQLAGGSTHPIYVVAVEYAGVDHVNAVNATAQGAGKVSQNGAPTTGNVTTTVAGAKLVATAWDSNESYNASGNGTGYTSNSAAGAPSATGGPGWANLTEDETAATAGTWTATASKTGANGWTVDDWAIQVVALAPGPLQTVTADATGSYTFANVSNGTFTVTPSKSGVTFSPSSQAVTVNAANVTGVNFSATAPTGTISGTVTNSSGTAISGATVSYSGGSTTTSSTGTYTLSNVPAGTVSVTASATGYQNSIQSVTVTAGTTTTQNFTLSAATGTISGTVTNSSGTAISGATVSYSGGSTTTSSTGTYTLSNVPAGTVSVTASATGYQNSIQSVTVTAGTTTTQNFTLSATTGTISGTVKNSSGTAISGATVSYSGGSTTSSSTGTYTLSNVPTGTVSVTASATGYQNSTVGVTVTTNNTTTQNFTLSATTGTISGTVTNSSGTAISGATVSYSGGSTTSSSTGTYTLSNVPTGTVSVTASATGYQSSTVSVTVTANVTTTQNFALSPVVGTTGTIAGTVTNSSGTAISGATVSYSGGSTTTSSTGAYTLSSVPAGPVSVTASATGYQSSTQSVTVTANTTSTLNFTLSTQGYSIQGTMTPVSIGAGASVALGGAVPVLVQSAHGSSATGTSSTTVSFAAASGAGHAILVFTKSGGNQVSSITDNQAGGSNTYTAVGAAAKWGLSPNPTDRWGQVFVAKNIKGGNVLTLTVKLAGASTHPIYASAVEYSGVDLTNPVNATAVGSGKVSQNGAPTTGNASTTVANAKLVATAWDSNESYNSAGNGAGYTTDSAAGAASLTGGPGWANLTEDESAVTPGTWNATASSSGANGWKVDDWLIQLVVLTPATLQTVTGDTNGNYTFTNLTNGTYAVTPSQSGHTFTPASQSVTVTGANLTGINFTGN